MQKVLVTGGCGYIGSHTIVDLLEAGYQVVSIDNFNNSEPVVLDRIENITGVRVKNYAIDLCESKATTQVFDEHPDIQGIIHFAALKSVEESVSHPMRYFINNLGSLMTVAQEAKARDIECLVYSSSCTVYGKPEVLPVTENTPLKKAESPYGSTKQLGEEIIRQSFQEGATRVISLRYFNPAGAHPSTKLGESPRQTATNLVPVITETAYGLRPQMQVFGTDYATRDGTCVRDYIHVMDLARAHRLAMEASWNGTIDKQFEVINLGIGQGVTVLEAIKAFESISGESLNYTLEDRRPGDVPAIFADYSYASQILDWHPEFDVRDIMHSAWEWEKARRS